MIATSLPVEAQFSVVSNIVTGDFNKDGNMDVSTLGQSFR